MMPFTQESSKELLSLAMAADREARQLLANARSTADLTKKLELTNRAAAKMDRANRLRQCALQVKLAEIREASQKPTRSYIAAWLFNEKFRAKQ